VVVTLDETARSTMEAFALCVVACRASCCRDGHFHIHVTTREMRALKADGDKRGTFRHLANEKMHDGSTGRWLMSRNPDGTCPYLDDESNLCTVYEHRPSACASFPHRPFHGCLLNPDGPDGDEVKARPRP
jgi:Fe-S-cluster containining protein